MSRRVAVVLLLAPVLAATGCRTPSAPPPSAAQPITAPATTPAPPVTAPALETVPCTATPPVTFALLCEAVEIVTETHVDPPDPAALAAAAVLGVDQVEGGGEAVPPPRPGPLHCALPDPAFETVCEAVAERTGELPVASLVEGAVQGMFRYGLDPFSSYIPPDLADRLDAVGSGLVPTLGLIVAAVDETGTACAPISAGCRFTVLAVFDFTAAAREGVVVGDVITEIDGSALEGLTASEATALLIADAGTAVEVVVSRPSGPLPKRLVHEDIRLLPIEYAPLEGNVVHLRLNDFSQVSAQLLGRALQADEVRNASGMVLDLRDNPGGLVLAAQAVASQFLDGGDVMVEHLRDGSYPLPVIEGGLAPDGLDLVVLVNRGSASASEVVAAVLQERGRALVVGEPTFGKNLVQEPHRTRNGGEIRVSVARWTTPGGLDIGVTGLTPDVLVEPAGDGGDPVLEQALALLR